MPKTSVKATGPKLPPVISSKSYSQMNRKERKAFHTDSVMGMNESAKGVKFDGKKLKERNAIIKREHKNDKRALDAQNKSIKRQEKLDAANMKRKAKEAKRRGKKASKVEQHKQMTEIDTKAHTKRAFTDATSKALLYGAVGTALTPAIVSIFGDDSDGTGTGTSK